MSKNVNEIPESIKSYKIEKEAFKLSNLTLYNGINTDINEKVLIHVFPKEEIKSNANEVTFMNNHVYLMKLLNHKNILKLFEIIETKTHAFLIYEDFEGEKLSDYITKKKKLTEDETMDIFKDLLSVLVYLHDMYLCNLNINSDNIIIDAKKNIKICDFKFGHFYSPKQKSKTTLIGDYSFTCPELHSKKPYNPELADMWSCGILLYQMVTGQLPFKSKNELDLIRDIMKGDYSIPNSISENMKNLIKGLIEKKEENRFKINDLFNQQIFKNKNITKSSLTQGLNILIAKYPIDGTVLNICKNKFGIDVANIIKNLENNRFTPVTSLFKQIVIKLSKKGIHTINDLCSEKFLAYLGDQKNNLNEQEQINNIQNYLKKEEEIKKNSQDVAAILLNNQNEISKGLEDLKNQYEEIKEGITDLIRNRSFGNQKNRRRRTFQLDNNKDIMDELNARNINKISNPKNANANMKPVKRNTVLVPDLEGLKINKKEKKKKDKKDKKAQPGGRFANKDDKNINEIKEEEKSRSSSENSEESKSSSNSEDEDDKNKEGKKSEVKKPVDKKPEAKKPEVKKPEVKKPEKNKIEEKEVKNVIFSKNMGQNPFAGIKLTKVNANNPPAEQKHKKILVNNQQNDMFAIKKKIENNDKKVKLNLKKEEIERENNILKIKSELKKGSNAKSTVNIKTTTAAKNEPAVSGFKNIREMIEANIKKNQRVMSQGVIRGDKKKTAGK